MRIAINGFGRIGRTFLRTFLSAPELFPKNEIVAINIGPGELAATAHLFKYDTTMGSFEGSVTVSGNLLTVGSHKIRLFAEKSAEALPWHDLDVDWVVECSGHYTKSADAQQHIRAGARKVLISAPAQDPDVTIIPGVNEHLYDRKNHLIISLGSCTTNALMPTLKVIQETWGIEQAFVVTTHAYTNSQALLDGVASSMKDLRRHRAAPCNIVPAPTGAQKMIAEIFPQLSDKVSATAVRVPVSNVSLLEVTWNSLQQLDKNSIQKTFAAAAKNGLKGIVAVTDEQLVSSDFMGDPSSVIIDQSMTGACGTMGTVFGWYDNEWGYSCRMRDFLARLG